MDNNKIFEYFESQAKTGKWDSLYNPQNPNSYSFIIRVQKSIQFLNDTKDKTVCDLGCGTGILIPFIIENGGIYVGVDNSPEMIKTIHEKYLSHKKSDNISLISSDFHNLKTELQCDVVIGLGFIEYFSDPEKVVKTIYDNLPSGGQLILSFPNFYSLDYTVLQMFSPFRYVVRKLFNKSTPQPPRKLWTLQKAEKMFNNVGFNSLEHIHYNINILFYPFSRFFPSFCNAIAKKLEYSGLSKIGFFSTGFIVSAKKLMKS